jgi:nitrogen fixation-related uncharacterized protein
MDLFTHTVDSLHPGAIFLAGLIVGWFFWG